MISPLEYRARFESVADDAARRIGFDRVDDLRLEGRVLGLPLAVFVETTGSEMGGSSTHTVFLLSLSGWPAECELVVRPIRDSASKAGLPVPDGWPRWRRWPLLRRRYVWFGDPSWDDAFIVQAGDPDIARLQLDARRRAAIMAKASEVRRKFAGRGDWRTDGWQWHYTIERGRLRSVYQTDVPSPDRMATIVEDMADLARTLTH